MEVSCFRIWLSAALLRSVLWQTFTDVSEVFTAPIRNVKPWSPWRLKRKVCPLKRGYISTSLHDAVTQKSAIFGITVVRTQKSPILFSVSLFSYLFLLLSIFFLSLRRRFLPTFPSTSLLPHFFVWCQNSVSGGTTTRSLYVYTSSKFHAPASQSTHFVNKRRTDNRVTSLKLASVEGITLSTWLTFLVMFPAYNFQTSVSTFQFFPYTALKRIFNTENSTNWLFSSPWGSILIQTLTAGSNSEQTQCLLRNQKLHNHVHNSPLPVPILIHTQPNSLRSILIISSHVHLGLSSGLFPSGFPTKILYRFTSPMRAACPTHLILLDLIVVVVFCEDHAPSTQRSKQVRNKLMTTIFGSGTPGARSWQRLYSGYTVKMLISVGT
jgi:hypothetical protein